MCGHVLLGRYDRLSRNGDHSVAHHTTHILRLTRGHVTCVVNLYMLRIFRVYACFDRRSENCSNEPAAVEEPRNVSSRKPFCQMYGLALSREGYTLSKCLQCLHVDM
jgi:hypothetical protein